jgi:hypothetical protein
LKTVIDSEELAAWPKTETGQLSVSKDHLSRLADRRGARPVLEMLAKEKLLSSFGTKLRDIAITETQRLHTHYGIAAAKRWALYIQESKLATASVS